jgi:hypothetical protein
VVYVSDRTCSFTWDRAGQLGKSGEYQMGRLRVVYFHIRSSKGGSPRLCRLRTDRLTLVNKTDYVLAHTRFMGSHKLSSFDGCWVGRHSTILHGWHWDSVGATHRLPIEVFTWKTTLGYSGPGSTLIVIVKGGHSCYLRGSRLSCCQVRTLQGYFILIQISATPSDMGDACSLLSFRRSVISPCSHET